MGMPNYLVLVRHGESEGNVANRLSRAGDNSHFTQFFRDRTSFSFFLTEDGRKQALAAGEWLRTNLPIRFDRCYASEYLRAMETAVFLGLPEENSWRLEYVLCEREWGELDNLPDDERRALFAKEITERKKSLFFWRPPKGESLADVCTNRVDRFLDTLHREATGKNVIVVCHGEIMECFVVRLEHLYALNFSTYDQDPDRKIHNGQIIIYTRVNPQTKEIGPYLNWRRSVCPWKSLGVGRECWEEVVRTDCKSSQLLNMIESARACLKSGVSG